MNDSNSSQAGMQSNGLQEEEEETTADDVTETKVPGLITDKAPKNAKSKSERRLTVKTHELYLKKLITSFDYWNNKPLDVLIMHFVDSAFSKDYSMIPVIILYLLNFSLLERF